MRFFLLPFLLLSVCVSQINGSTTEVGDQQPSSIVSISAPYMDEVKMAYFRVTYPDKVVKKGEESGTYTLEVTEDIASQINADLKFFKDNLTIKSEVLWATFDNYQHLSSKRNPVETIKKFLAHTFTEGLLPLNSIFIIEGPTGTGKSHLAVSAAKYLMGQGKSVYLSYASKYEGFLSDKNDESDVFIADGGQHVYIETTLSHVLTKCLNSLTNRLIIVTCRSYEEDIWSRLQEDMKEQINGLMLQQRLSLEKLSFIDQKSYRPRVFAAMQQLLKVGATSDASKKPEKSKASSSLSAAALSVAEKFSAPAPTPMVTLKTIDGRTFQVKMMSAEGNNCALYALGFDDRPTAMARLLSMAHDEAIRRLIVPEIRVEVFTKGPHAKFIWNDPNYASNKGVGMGEIRTQVGLTQLNSSLLNTSIALSEQEASAQERARKERVQTEQAEIDEKLTALLSSKEVFTKYVTNALGSAHMITYLPTQGDTSILDALAHIQGGSVTVWAKLAEGIKPVHRYTWDDSTQVFHLLHTRVGAVGGQPGTLLNNQWNHFNKLVPVAEVEQAAPASNASIATMVTSSSSSVAVSDVADSEDDWTDGDEPDFHEGDA